MAEVTEERKQHLTPNGGVASVIYYLDDEGQPTTKDHATRAEIQELDANGEMILRTYMRIGRNNERV